ncbi:MAG TPA: EamA family transporter RarD [Pirellulaceae bacterium]|nr:EamA family transporter RarD [Pirellulaceae bacterium]
MGDGDGSSNAARVGVFYGIAAYALWGIFPLYFAMLFKCGVTPWEVLANRIVWSCVLLAIIVTIQWRWDDLLAAVRNRRVLLTLIASTLLIATNWLTFLYAVSTEQVLQSSLGYFLTPLANVILGMAVFGERLRRGQLIGVALAAIGVTWMAVAEGELPWIALALALSFAFYGLCRKTVAVDSLLGLTIETMLLAPLALLYLLGLRYTNTATDVSWDAFGLLVFSGLATALPLLFFASAARRLRFVTLGFLQYLGPTLQFVCAVLIFKEAFGPEKVISFAFIWAAVAIYSFDSLWAYSRPLANKPVPVMPLEDL